MIFELEQALRELLAKCESAWLTEEDAYTIITALRATQTIPKMVVDIVWSCGTEGHEHSTREDAQVCIDDRSRQMKAKKGE